LACKPGRTFRTLAGYEKNSAIQTAVLWELCHALKHNFFLDIACQLPAEFTYLCTEAKRLRREDTDTGSGINNGYHTKGYCDEDGEKGVNEKVHFPDTNLLLKTT